MNLTNISNYSHIIEKPNVNINFNQAISKEKPVLHHQEIQEMGVNLYSLDYLHLFIIRNFYTGIIIYFLFILQYFFIYRKLMKSTKMPSFNKLTVCVIEAILLFILYLNTINIFYLFDYIFQTEITIQILLAIFTIPLFIIGVNIVFYTIVIYKTLQ